MLGMTIRVPGPQTVLDLIVEADRAGIDAVWLQAGGLSPDPLTLFAAAALRTERIHLGTAIVPTWPRHPLVVAQQALVLEALAPGRITLGVGPSTAGAMRAFGVNFRKPLTQLREYLTVLRDALALGSVDMSGEFFRARGRLGANPGTPVMASALQEGAFELCGELTDGAITWLCPRDYVRTTGLPAMRRGAERAGRLPPPVVLHVLICQESDPARVVDASSAVFGPYTQFQFYRDMFTAAGHPPSDEPCFSPELVESLVLYGSDDEIRERLRALGDEGFEHLMVTPVPIGDPVEAVRNGMTLLAGV